MKREKLTTAALLFFVAIMILGTILLFTGITLDSLWYDESYTAATVNQPLRDIINISGGDSHPPLYYLMLRLFRLAFGYSELSLRTFSVLGVLALAFLGMGPIRRGLGTRVGLLYSLMVFVMPITVAMAHEARMYTWAAFWVTGSAIYGFLAQQEGKRKDWILFVLFTLAAAYTHYYALLAVVILCGLMFLGCLRDKKKLLSFLAAAGVLLAGYLPWIIKLAGQVGRVSKNFWISPVTGKLVLSVFSYPFGFKFQDPNHLGLALPAFFIALAWVLWGIYSSVKKKEPESKMALLAFGSYILTIMGGVVASLIIRPVLVERYMIPVLGLFILGLAYGLSTNQKRLSLALACGVIIALSIPQTYTALTTRVNGPMKEVEAALSMQVQPGDVFLHTDEHTFGTFCYYFPGQNHYYYQREGYEGFSNYDAFKPNGFTIDSLDEIGEGHRIWLVQRPGAGDRISAGNWFSTGALVVEQPAIQYSVPTSWYSASVRLASIGDPETMQASGTPVKEGMGNLKVHMDGMKNDQGTAVFLLYNQDPMNQAPFMFTAGSITGGQAEGVFTDLAYGDYSIMAFHDENSDNQMAMDGDLPTEGLGYSNAMGPPEGPPDFESCKFRFDDKTGTINITVYYLK